MMVGFPGERWTALPFSGCLSDIGAGKVDVVVVYKIDRLTRSLFDFAKIVEAFDAKGVSFVSVTQQFNTTTSMGRLTLNVLLSFAQFEREVTSERIRDKIAASKQKGMWMGGAVPLGYDAVNRKLRINAEEAKTVRLLFELYLKLGSVRQLQEECQRLEAANQAAHDAGWKTFRGDSVQPWAPLPHPFQSDSISAALHTRVAATTESTKPSSTLRPGTRSRLSSRRTPAARGAATSSKHPSLLAGLLFTADGVPFTPSHAVNHGRRYRYYVERSLLTPEAEKGTSSAPQLNGGRNGVQTKGWRLPAHEIEQLVLKQVTAFLRDRGALLDALRSKRKSPDVVSALFAHASKLADACEAGSFTSQSEIVAALVRRITVAQDQLTIEIDHDGLVERLLGQDARSQSRGKDHSPILIKASVRFRRRGVEAKLVVLD